MIVLTIVLGLPAIALLLATVSDVASLCRLPWQAGERDQTHPTSPRFLFLVPAHDEELLLGLCLGSLRRLHYPAQLTDVVVIADNCRDRTAEIAHRAGVRCLERTAPTSPGKPQAIAWALPQLALSNYDGIVIVDADTELDPEFPRALAARAPLAHKALQPYNDVGNRTQNALTRMAAVLSAANHGLAFVLKTRVGLNVPLSAGMCIGSRVLAEHGWDSFTLSEDWELYARLTELGMRIEAVPGARIYAQEAATLKTSTSQRRRWTAGKLAVIRTRAWPLIRSRHIGYAQKLDALAELTSPGPVVQLGVVTAAAAVLLLLRPPAFEWVLGALCATLLRPFAYTVGALVRDPEPLRALRAFLFLPFYGVWRVGVALISLVALKEAPWIRTGRHEHSTARQTP